VEGIMPFDGRNAILATRESLAAAIAVGRVEAVDPYVLDQHKAEELHRHPAGWISRHRVAVQITTLVLLLAGTIASFATAFFVDPAAGVSVALATLACAIAQSLVPVRGPAFWRERAINELSAVHPVIRDSALRLQKQLPDVKFKLGELIQDSITLDPYLIAEYWDERAVLGIWDSDKLIAPSPYA
jgi:hypothetical protein